MAVFEMFKYRAIPFNRFRTFSKQSFSKLKLCKTTNWTQEVTKFGFYFF